MKVYVFGNEDISDDNRTFKVVKKLEEEFHSIKFKFVKPNEDLPFIDEKDIIILDTVEGIDKTTLISDEKIENFILSPRASVHDFDLGFQLRYLKKLGKLGKVKIIGIPMTGNLNYRRISSIFKKLVAQDIQGS